jgi:hypothetical protein
MMNLKKLLVSIGLAIAMISLTGTAGVQKSLEFSGKLDLGNSASSYHGSMSSDGRIEASGPNGAKCSGSTKVETTVDDTRFRHGQMRCTTKTGVRKFEVRTVGIPMPGGSFFAFENGVGYRLDFEG